MKNAKVEHNAVCPFYHKHGNFKNNDARIVCDGIAPCIAAQQTFRSVDAAKKHLDKFCSTFAYDKCPYATCLIYYFASK